MTQYSPDAGTPCTASKRFPGATEVKIHDSDGRDHVLIAESGVIRYPGEKEDPGNQWCEMTFTGQVPDTGHAYAVSVGIYGSEIVQPEDLFGGLWIIVNSDGIEVGRL